METISPRIREEVGAAIRGPRLSHAGVLALSRRMIQLSEEDDERQRLRRRLSGTVQLAEIPARHEPTPETIVDDERARLAQLEFDEATRALVSKLGAYQSRSRDRSIRLSEEHRVAGLVARDAARGRSYAPPLRRNYELS